MTLARLLLAAALAAASPAFGQSTDDKEAERKIEELVGAVVRVKARALTHREIFQTRRALPAL